MNEDEKWKRMKKERRKVTNEDGKLNKKLK